MTDVEPAALTLNLTEEESQIVKDALFDCLYKQMDRLDVNRRLDHDRLPYRLRIELIKSILTRMNT